MPPKREAKETSGAAEVNTKRSRIVRIQVPELFEDSDSDSDTDDGKVSPVKRGASQQFRLNLLGNDVAINNQLYSNGHTIHVDIGTIRVVENNMIHYYTVHAEKRPSKRVDFIEPLTYLTASPTIENISFWDIEKLIRAKSRQLRHFFRNIHKAGHLEAEVIRKISEACGKEAIDNEKDDEDMRFATLADPEDEEVLPEADN